MKSLNELSKNLRAAIPIIILVLILLVLSLYVFDFGSEVGYSWRGIVPGETSAEEVKNRLGDPAEEGNLAEGNVHIIKYVFEGESAKIYLREDKVVLAKIGGKGTLQKESFDSDLNVFYSANYRDYIIGLYLDEGRGKVVHELTGLAIENWYFAPTTEIDLKAKLVGMDKLQEEKPIIF